MELTPPRAVLFDWDNTLVDTWPIIHKALHETFTHYGMTPWTLEETKNSVARSMREAFPDLFGAQWEEAGLFYQQSYRKYHIEWLKPLPGALETIRLLKKVPPYMGVVSNKKGDNLREEVDHLEWKNYFRVIVGAQDAEADKPHPAPVCMALEDSGIELDKDVWFIGDSVVDLECAEACGVTGILYGDHETQMNGTRSGTYKGFPFHAHAKNHTELQLLIEEYEPVGV
jgi:phosphoglycolate phosphatase